MEFKFPLAILQLFHKTTLPFDSPREPEVKKKSQGYARYKQVTHSLQGSCVSKISLLLIWNKGSTKDCLPSPLVIVVLSCNTRWKFSTCVNVKFPLLFSISWPTILCLSTFSRPKIGILKNGPEKAGKPDRHFLFDLLNRSATSTMGTCQAMLEGLMTNVGNWAPLPHPKF